MGDCGLGGNYPGLGEHMGVNWEERTVGPFLLRKTGGTTCVTRYKEKHF